VEDVLDGLAERVRVHHEFEEVDLVVLVAGTHAGLLQETVELCGQPLAGGRSVAFDWGVRTVWTALLVSCSSRLICS
jgi:hypothetical protein